MNVFTDALSLMFFGAEVPGNQCELFSSRREPLKFQRRTNLSTAKTNLSSWKVNFFLLLHCNFTKKRNKVVHIIL